MSTSSLATTIQTVRERVQQARKNKRALTEQDTKVTLINPLLRALGWDLEDWDEVRFEYRHKGPDRPVDYALFLYRTPSLFVEAKSLDMVLADRKWVSQTIAYASTVGVTWCVLTDGNEYRLYNAHAPVDADEKLFRSLRIDDGDSNEIAETLELLSKENMGENKLSTLWEAHFVDRQVKATLEDLVTKQDDSLVRLIHRRTKGVTQGNIRKSLQRADVQLDFPMLSSMDLNAASAILPPHEDREHQVPEVAPEQTRNRSGSRISLADIIGADLIATPFQLEVTFKKQHLTATVHEDGSVEFQGARYESPSPAAGYARNVVSGPPKDGRAIWQTNGWAFWKYRDPESGELVPLDTLRQRYLEKHSA